LGRIAVGVAARTRTHEEVHRLAGVDVRLRDRQRLAINVGVLSYALAVLGFYFESVYDKLGRSLGLIGLGVLQFGVRLLREANLDQARVERTLATVERNATQRRPS